MKFDLSTLLSLLLLFFCDKVELFFLELDKVQIKLPEVIR